ncbi:MAG TPA: 4Fe-4S dicluster domain-containing protein [Candidatus Brocadiales bacterium]|nr:4Fe-4S dicluster domain-containing protein [Candidatus Brocadiales bacterium]
MANPTQVAFYFNQDRCVGCRACEGACKQENNLPVEVRYRRVIFKESGLYPKVHRTFASIACNHCVEPACMKACPVNAIRKRKKDGIVLINQKKCIGCRRCEFACPYGAPQYNPHTKKVEKCHYCVHRIDRKDVDPDPMQDALNHMPACVVTCMGLALFSAKLSDLDAGNLPDNISDPHLSKKVPDFPDPRLTDPAIRFTLAKNV